MCNLKRVILGKKLLPYNNRVIKTTEKHVSTLGYQGMDCTQW